MHLRMTRDLRRISQTIGIEITWERKRAPLPFLWCRDLVYTIHYKKSTHCRLVLEISILEMFSFKYSFYR